LGRLTKRSRVSQNRAALHTIAHITLFDTHPFFQQSFVNAMGFLVKSGKAQRSDFHFMEDMKKKRGRFSLELAPVPETG
jgi:hypothetical protein